MKKISNGILFSFRDAIDESVIDSNAKNLYLSQIPEYSPAKTDIIIDIGAHIGAFSLNLSGNVKRIYSVELFPETYRILMENIRQNNLMDIVIPINSAISLKNGNAYISENPDGHTGNTITSNFSKQSLTTTMTLQSLLKSHGIIKCNFIKMNCEGSEFEIVSTFDSSIYDIIDSGIILYHCDLNTSRSVENIENKLKAIGYKYRFFRKTLVRGWIIFFK